MTTKAYVLINVKAGKVKDVVKALVKVKGVKTVHPCWGRPDIFTFVEVPDEKSLSELVLTQIHVIEGIQETDTHLIVEA